MKIEICRPQLIDKEEIQELFSITLKNNFEQEGIILSHKDELDTEINSQFETLGRDFVTQGQQECFLIAKVNRIIIGTIAFGSPNQIIQNNIATILNIPEVKSVYVLPNFQNKGIGTMLLQSILKLMSQNNIHEFYLDSGYKKAQGYWLNKLGAPVCILKEFWNKNSDHMIWHTKIHQLNR